MKNVMQELIEIREELKAQAQQTATRAKECDAQNRLESLNLYGKATGLLKAVELIQKVIDREQE